MTPAESRDDTEKTVRTEDGVEFDIVGENGEVLMRNNRLTVDDPSRQALSSEEIEELKKASTGSGKEIIEKIMNAHSALGEKTSFSLAKYTLRKSRKYMRRFTVLPLTVDALAEVMLEKEHGRILEMRRETLGLITSWANVRVGVPYAGYGEHCSRIGGGRWLVVDDTGGLVVAAMAEKMGILHLEHDEALEDENTDNPASDEANSNGVQEDPMDVDERLKQPDDLVGRSRKTEMPAQSASHNSITLVHPSAQGNLSLLKYFGYIAEDPSPSHPLYTNLKTLTWLQLLDPEADQLYHEPPRLSEEQLSQLKSGKRGTYWRKRRRWERVKSVVDETRAGGFDGLIVSSFMKPEGVLKHLVPLVRGGGQMVVYSPTVEPVTQLMDYYSRERKGAYVRQMQKQRHQANGHQNMDEEDFPLNPTLILNPMLQTSRAKHWQVLPSRTHPLMTSKGGAEGYLFTATRVIPANANIQARGKFGKKRKANEQQKAAEPPTDDAEQPKTEQHAEEGASDTRAAKATRVGEAATAEIPTT
jgi:tRNA (adenine58-N1)-methyltransferase non-catalytic subunit